MSANQSAISSFGLTICLTGKLIQNSFGICVTLLTAWKDIKVQDDPILSKAKQYALRIKVDNNVKIDFGDFGKKPGVPPPMWNGPYRLYVDSFYYPSSV